MLSSTFVDKCEVVRNVEFSSESPAKSRFVCLKLTIYSPQPAKGYAGRLHPNGLVLDGFTFREVHLLSLEKWQHELVRAPSHAQGQTEHTSLRHALGENEH